MNLYDISQEYLFALDNLQVDEETGEILNYENVEAVGSIFEEKAESIDCYIKNLSSMAESIKAEEKKLAERRKQSEKKAENLEKYLSSCMLSTGNEKIETAKTKISFRKSTQVEISDENNLSEEYKIKTITVKPDKTAIKKAIQSGVAVTGACLVENKNIQIK